MPGALPGPVGITVFAGVKFCGYMFAGVALKKVYPSISAAAWKIAGARTGFGVLLGPVVVIGSAYLTTVILKMRDDSFAPYYVLLVALRILIWAAIVRIFAGSQLASPGKWLGIATAGAAWSCLLDIPAAFLAFASPGAIPFC